MAADFIVGALFDIDAGPAVGALERLGEAFAATAEKAAALRDAMGLDSFGIGKGEGLFAGLDRQFEATTELARGVGIALSEGITVAVEKARVALGGLDGAFATLSRGSAVAPIGSGGRVPETETDIRENRLARIQKEKELNYSPGIGLGEMVAGLTLAAAGKASMNEDISIQQALLGMNIGTDDPRYAEDKDRLRGLAYTATRGTIFTEAQAAEAMKEALPVLGFTGQKGVEQAEAIFPVALRLGELSKLRHKGEVGSEAVAGEEFAHLLQQFDPVGLEKALDLVNIIATRTDTSIQRQLSIDKYALPVAIAAGIKPEDAVADVGAAQLRLGPTSTAGTGYARFLLGSLESGGGINAQLPHALHESAKQMGREFENALKLQPDAVASADARAAKGSLHDRALERLGIVDKHGKFLDVDARGNRDLDREKQQIFDYGRTHSRQDLENTLKDAYGIQGFRYAEAYAEPGYIEREREQKAGMLAGKSVREQQTELANTPMQNMQQMVANFANMGNTIATATLPTLNEAFRTTSEIVGGINDFLKGHPAAANTAGDAAIGKIVGGIVGAIGGLIFGGPAGSILGRSIGAGVGGAVGGGAVGGLYGWISNNIGSTPNPEFGMPFDLTPRGGFQAPLPALPQAPPTARDNIPTQVIRPEPGPVTVNLGGVTFNGVEATDPSFFQGLIARLTSAVAAAMANVTSDAHGVTSSVYTFPGGL